MPLFDSSHDFGINGPSSFNDVRGNQSNTVYNGAPLVFGSTRDVTIIVNSRDPAEHAVANRKDAIDETIFNDVLVPGGQSVKNNNSSAAVRATIPDTPSTHRFVRQLVRDLTSDDIQTVNKAIDGLVNISTDDERRIVAVHSSSIRHLVRYIASVKFRSIRTPAVRALGNINILGEAQVISVNEDVVPRLVDLMNSERGDTNILLCVCEALRNICSTEEMARTAALRDGAVPPLLQLLSHNDTRVITMAASALRNICIHAPAAAVVLAAKAVPTVVRRLTFRDYDVQKSAALLLSSLFCASQAARIEGITSVPDLVRLIESGVAHVQTAAAQALLNITVLEKARKAAVKAKAIPVLVKSISSGSRSNETDTLRFACGALGNICRTSEGPALAMNYGAVPHLVRLLSHDNAEVQFMASSALSKVCVNHRAADVAQKLGAVPAIVRLFASDDPGILHSAALLLSNLCYERSPACYDALKSNAIPALVHLLKSHEPMVQSVAVRVLANVNNLEEARMVSVGANATSALVNLLHSSDNDVLKGACMALGSICRAPFGSQDAVDAGAVPALNILHAHSDSEVRKMAKVALNTIETALRKWNSAANLLMM